jgi:hypothetical protein
MKNCVTHKKMYPSKEIAEDALIEARTQFDYTRDGGPVGVYQCEDCGQFHLTSKGAMNPRLAEQLANGKIARQKEAARWLDKLKHR